MRVAVSLKFEHGVFIKEDARERLGMKEGDVLEAYFPKEGVSSYEICKKYADIKVEKEARMLLGLFVNLSRVHYLFLAENAIFSKVRTGSSMLKTLVQLYPEFDIKSDSAFRLLYRNVEDVISEIPPFTGKFPKKAAKKVDAAVAKLSKELEEYYKRADCVIGAGTYVSTQLSKPVELSFGIGELDIGVRWFPTGKFSLLANPHVLRWIIDDHCSLRRNKANWAMDDIELKRPQNVREDLIEEVTVRSYVPPKEVTPLGASEDTIKKILRAFMLVEKPYILRSDFLFPFHCPSLVTGVKTVHEKKRMVGTSQGGVPTGEDVIPKMSELTRIKVEFFSFPRFNRKCPLVLDTSSVDISRFPLGPAGSLYTAYLEDRDIIIPKVVMHELKTRLRTADRPKVERALLKLSNLRMWGLIKNIIIEGEVPELGHAPKKDIEDWRDCMILDVARSHNGVVFTNDEALIKFAALVGIYCIMFRGLEEDVMTVIKENNLKLTIEETVQKTRQ